MSDFLEIFNFELSPASFSEFIVSLISNIIFSLILRKIYLTYSHSVSNKILIANLFPLFSVAIFLIILTIKTSIVLSLGLVGALSIIRFRTAIKEPEQIVFFLIITSISISSAAGAILFPFIVIVFTWSYYFYLDSKLKDSVYSINDQLVISGKDLDIDVVNELVLFLLENRVNVEIQSINDKVENKVVVMRISNFTIDIFKSVKTFFKNKKQNKIEVQFFSSSE